MKLSNFLDHLLSAIEWIMTGLLILVGGLEIVQSPWLSIAHIGFAILICPKTPLHRATKAILIIFAFISTFI